MAGDGERRMLFDIRGRRKHVVRVVYAILALLMGASLFVVVGPFNLAEVVGGGGTSSADEVFDEQVERIEGRLAKDPKDEALLLSFTRANISAGNAKSEEELEGESPQLSSDARNNFQRALQTWNRYLKVVGDEPNPVAAQLVGSTYFRLAEVGSASVQEIESNIDAAVKAQRIAAEERPNVGSLSSLAIYEFFNGNFEAGDKATKQAMASVPKGAEAKTIKQQLGEYRRNAKQYVKSLEQAAKRQKESGGAQLQNPFGGVGSGNPGSLGE
jgi:tetratricopeptide (TPR) repeat protein